MVHFPLPCLITGGLKHPGPSIFHPQKPRLSHPHMSSKLHVVSATTLKSTRPTVRHCYAAPQKMLMPLGGQPSYFGLPSPDQTWRARTSIIADVRSCKNRQLEVIFPVATCDYRRVLQACLPSDCGSIELGTLW